MKYLFTHRVKIIAILVMVGVLLGVLYAQDRLHKPNIKFGVLHSLSGTMAASEKPLVDALQFALEEINQSGGINGAKLEMVLVDCRSDNQYCAQQAEKLISQEQVKALFGCWTSACRKAVKSVVEKHHHLLFYPLQYEGLEQSPDIFYTGAVPNQQIIPMALWAAQHKGKRFYLLGSDYLFPRTANLIVKELLQAQGGQLLGETYLALGQHDVGAVVQDIIKQQPDFVLNTLNGDTNVAFFQTLYAAGVRAEHIPVFSSSISEVELEAMGPQAAVGHYATWNYFQSLDSADNKSFVARFKQRFGPQRLVNDPMAASYVGLKLWAAALQKQDSYDLALIKTILSQQSLLTPNGMVVVDYDSQHLWKNVYLGKVRFDGQFDVVWQSDQLVHPEPFPFYHTRSEWMALQQSVLGGKP